MDHGSWIMEESLREAACNGNLQGVQKLLQSGTNINSQNRMNGWTALHWACKRGHTEIVSYLLQSGANVTIKTHNGELPLDLASSSTDCRKLLSRPGESHPASENNFDSEGVKDLPIVPNYLKNPVFPYYEVKVDEPFKAVPHSNGMAKQQQTAVSSELNSHVSNLSIDSGPSGNAQLGSESCKAVTESAMIIKARVCDEKDSDFIEVEVPSPTYQSLLTSVCDELEVVPTDVTKIRKLPNILIRKDKDVQRLREGQELEVILT